MASTLEQTRTAPATLRVEDGIAVIRLDQPGKPVNVLPAETGRALTDIIRRLEEGGRGARGGDRLFREARRWIAGADIEEFGSFQTAADGEPPAARGMSCWAGWSGCGSR